jgi:hypothetical protein
LVTAFDGEGSGGGGGVVPSVASPGGKVHLVAFGACGLILAGWALALGVTLTVAGARDDRSGPVLAVFERGLDEIDVLARVARAGGVVMRGTWFGNVWQVHGEHPGFARELRALGAVHVLPTLPYDAFSVGGCSYGYMPAATAAGRRGA